jgi:hypothetical protein
MINYYTSRSAIESRQDCPRKRYLQYHYNQKGIVPANKSIPLTTGSCVHSGVEFMLRQWKEQPDLLSIPVLIDYAVETATRKYKELLEGRGFSNILEKEQEFTKLEQLSLTEALVRAWGMKEFPLIIKNYRILEIEKELVESYSFGFDDDPKTGYIGNPPYSVINFQGKPDIILETKDSNKDILVYSLKTIKDFAWYVEKSYKRDLQGVTESYLTNKFLQAKNSEIDHLVTAILNHSSILDFREKLVDFTKSKKVNSNVSGIKFCYLIKGTRKESDYDPRHYITYNPLIRGYRKVTTTGVEFAHSWFYPNPENKSGKSILRKGWEPFNVWESEHFEGSIYKWMKELEGGKIQPNCPDPIKGVVVTPIEVRRDGREIVEDMEVLKREEISFFEKLSNLVTSVNQLSNLTELQEGLRTFGKTRKRCDYPTPCDYLPVCYGEDEKGNIIDNPLVQIDPIGSGYYEVREPHHEMEREGLG